MSLGTEPIAEGQRTRVAESGPSLMRRQSTQTLIVRVVAYLLAISLGLVFLAPFLFAVSGSLMTSYELYKIPPVWLPAELQFVNYANVWKHVPWALYTRNTLIITFLAMAGQLASSALVGYGFARFNFPGRNFLFIVLLGTMILPGEVVTIPQFILFKTLGWTNTFLPLTVPAFFGGSAFTIFLLRQFFLTIPRDLDDAARIDGASSLRVLVQLLVPLSKPALATVAILSFISHWNDFFGPLIYLSSKELFTVSLGLNFFRSTATEAGPPLAHWLMAASVLVTVPVILVFFSLQRYFIQGIVMSGIKG